MDDPSGLRVETVGLRSCSDQQFYPVFDGHVGSALQVQQATDISSGDHIRFLIEFCYSFNDCRAFSIAQESWYVLYRGFCYCIFSFDNFKSVFF